MTTHLNDHGLFRNPTYALPSDGVQGDEAEQRLALRNLAGLAEDADDFRLLADALGLDVELLRERR